MPVQSTVSDSYNAMAAQYTDWAENRPSPRLRYVDKLLSHLPPDSGARIVELGCGAGVPVTQYLARSDRVGRIVANDLSESQIALARQRVQDGKAAVEFVAGDMLELRLQDEGEVDGVLAFYSLFHLPLPAQFAMLQRIHAWLKPGSARLVCNFGAVPRGTEGEGEGWGEFFGEKMFWANAGTEGSLEMLEKAGFDVVEWEVLDGTEGLSEEEAERDADRGVKFLWVLAGKKG